MGDLRILNCGGREIKWLLTRKKVKNINLRIKTDGIVYISASSRVPVGYIERFIRQKSDFIFTNLDKFAARPAAPVLPEAAAEYKNGDTVCYFGENYTLSILISPKERAEIVGKNIAVYVKNAERTGRVLKKFYDTETEKLFRSLSLRTYLIFRDKGYDIPPSELQIRNMKSRWGSCHITDKKIVMNSRLALYPEVCSEYVFIHEYAHYVVPNHSAAFYAVVADIMPDYKVCVNILKN